MWLLQSQRCSWGGAPLLFLTGFTFPSSEESRVPSYCRIEQREFFWENLLYKKYCEPRIFSFSGEHFNHWTTARRHLHVYYSVSHLLSIVGLRLSSSMSTVCVVPLRGDWTISAALAQDGLAECDQPGNNPLKCSAMVGNWTRPSISWLKVGGCHLQSTRTLYIKSHSPNHSWF